MTEPKPTWDEVAADIFIEHHAAWQRLAQLDTAVEFPDERDERIAELEAAIEELRQSRNFQHGISQKKSGHIQEYRALLMQIGNLYPDVTRLDLWHELMGES